MEVIILDRDGWLIEDWQRRVNVTTLTQHSNQEAGHA
jgi:hypothetical protein